MAFLLTNAGAAYEADRISQKKPIEITHFAISSDISNPDPSAATLAQQLQKVAISQITRDVTDTSQMNIQAVFPLGSPASGTWNIEKIALYASSTSAATGDILYATANYKETKTRLKELVLNVALKTDNAANVSLEISNLAIATKAYVDSRASAVLITTVVDKSISIKAGNHYALINKTSGTYNLTVTDGEPGQFFIISITDNSGSGKYVLKGKINGGTDQDLDSIRYGNSYVYQWNGSTWKSTFLGRVLPDKEYLVSDIPLNFNTAGENLFLTYDNASNEYQFKVVKHKSNFITTTSGTIDTSVINYVQYGDPNVITLTIPHGMFEGETAIINLTGWVDKKPSDSVTLPNMRIKRYSNASNFTDEYLTYADYGNTNAVIYYVWNHTAKTWTIRHTDRLKFDDVHDVDVSNAAGGTYLTFNESTGKYFFDIARLLGVELVNTNGGLTPGIHNYIEITNTTARTFTLATGSHIGEMCIVDLEQWRGRNGQTLPDLTINAARSRGSDVSHTISFAKYGDNASKLTFSWNGSSWDWITSNNPVAVTSGSSKHLKQYDNKLSQTINLVSSTDNGNYSLYNNTGNVIALYGRDILTSNNGLVYQANGTEIKVAHTDLQNLVKAGIDEIKNIALVATATTHTHDDKQVFTTSTLSKSPSSFTLVDRTFIPQLASLEMFNASGGSITNYQVLAKSPTYIKQNGNHQATIAMIIYIPKTATIDYDSNAGMVAKHKDGSGNLGFKVTYNSKLHSYFFAESAGTIDNVLIHEYDLDKDYTLNSVAYDRYVYMSGVMLAQTINNEHRITPVLNADVPDTSTRPLPFSIVSQPGVLGQNTKYLASHTITDTYTISEMDALLALKDDKTNVTAELAKKANITLDNVTNANFETIAERAIPQVLEWTNQIISGGYRIHTIDGKGGNIDVATVTNVNTRVLRDLTNVTNTVFQNKIRSAEPRGVNIYSTSSNGWTVHTNDGNDTVTLVSLNYLTQELAKKSEPKIVEFNLGSNTPARTIDGSVYVYSDSSTVRSGTTKTFNLANMITSPSAGDIVKFLIYEMHASNNVELVFTSGSTTLLTTKEPNSELIFAYTGSAWQLKYNSMHNAVSALGGRLALSGDKYISATDDLISYKNGKAVKTDGTVVATVTQGELLFGGSDGSTFITNGTIVLNGSYKWADFDEIIFETCYSNGTARSQFSYYVGKSAPITKSGGPDVNIGDTNSYVNMNWRSTNMIDILTSLRFGISRIFGKAYNK